MSRPGTRTTGLAWALGAVAMGFAGCDASTATTPEEQALAELANEKWELLQMAPYMTRFQGKRRVAFTVTGPSGEPTSVAYVERVSCDGAGDFSVEPLYVESGSAQPDPATFLLLAQQRQGFTYRYRDFAVRDLDAFLSNYGLVSSRTEWIAGRECVVYSLVRQLPGGRHYSVGIDLETGLILRCAEFGDEGEEVARFEFTELDLAPDLSGVAYFVPSNDEVWFDLEADDAVGILGFEPRTPGVVPEGFVLDETSKVVDAEGERWLKLGFTDGVETLFFLHRPAADDGFDLPTLGSTAGSSSRGNEIAVYETSSVTVAQGTAEGQRFLVVGTADAGLLLDMIESAL